jgi:RHS repeat-associated protein
MTVGAQPVTVTSLGRYCAAGNSLTHELRVIRTSDNTVVASTNVSMSGCTQGQTRYATLASPVTLAASTAYLVVSYEVGSDNSHDYSGLVLTTTSVATVLHGIYTTNGGQTWGAAGGTGNSYVPVDFQYTTGGTADINWLVTDQLGTPRMTFDKTGALATTKRHDYLPFGEELSGGQGVRSTTPGYGTPDGVRQKFTSKERDVETGLDYFGARYFASTQGRFTSVDPMMASAKLSNPQTMNRYTYVVNNPLRYIDPNGLDGEDSSDPWSRMTKKEQLLLASKLTTVQYGYVPNQKQLAAAGKVFNDTVQAYTSDGSAVDLKQTTTNVASMKAFVAELGSNKEAWAQIDRIGKVNPQGEGRVAEVTFTAKNDAAFIGALKGDSRFRYRESDARHSQSFRRITISAADPSFHVVKDSPVFGAHWDPTSTFNLESQQKVENGVLTGNPMGAVGGLAEMGSAGAQHYGGKATVEQVQKFLTPSKQ